MPKPPETRDRFRIHGDCSIELLGPVLRELDKLGLTNIGHELVTDVLVYKQRAPRVPAAVVAAKPAKKISKGNGAALHEVTNKDFALQYFQGREQVTAQEMAEAFRKDGRNAGSSGAILTVLGQRKYCKSMGGGVWKVLAKGHQATEKEAANG
jgi:hypothetical protein